MTGALKKGVLLLLILFVGFYLFTDPAGLAELVRRIWDGITQLLAAMLDFLHAIVQ